MAKKIAVINLKGGVGKTTTTVGVATMLSGVHGKNTLVVDLDPQTNATIALIGEDDWKVLDESGLTLETVFRCAMAGGAPVDINRIIRKGVGNIAEARSIDLLPSSLGMIDIQDRLASTHGALYNDSPTDTGCDFVNAKNCKKSACTFFFVLLYQVLRALSGIFKAYLRTK